MNADLAYVAGFIDGEGCFTIDKNGSVTLSVINTFRPTLEFLASTLGVGKVSARKQKTNKAQFNYRAYGQDCVTAIQKLLPLLKEKRPQAETILEYRDTYKPIRIPGQRGQFRSTLRDAYRERMTKLKLEPV